MIIWLFILLVLYVVWKSSYLTIYNVVRPRVDYKKIERQRAEGDRLVVPIIIAIVLFYIIDGTLTNFGY